MLLFYLQCWEKFEVIIFWPWDLYQEVGSQAILCVSYFYCLGYLATGCVKMFLHRQWSGKGLFICFLVLRYIKQEQYFIERFYNPYPSPEYTDLISCTQKGARVRVRMVVLWCQEKAFRHLVHGYMAHVEVIGSLFGTML